MRIGVMATYPPRADSLRFTLSSLRSQLDKLVVVANEYEATPDFLCVRGVEVVIPDENLKDAGKFAGGPFDEGDIVFLVDDDIVYPPDYVSHLLRVSEELPVREHVVGVHGIIYSDFFDGDPASRVVYGFEQALESARVVNQLGTGTVMMRGDRMPGLDIMRSSAGFVDVRLARHCFQRGWPMISVPRTRGWLRGIRSDESLFDSVTKRHAQHESILQEIAEFGGFGRLPSLVVAEIEG